MKFRIHHVAISVNNIEETISFYKNIFGFKESCKYKDKDMEIWMLKLEDIKLEIFYFKDRKKLPDNNKKLSTNLSEIGVKHFALEVEDIEDTESKLKKLGVEFSTEIRKGEALSVKYCFIKDPNGILLELLEEIK